MIRPFFSIIVPCYNSKKTIGRLLQSIVDQHMLKSQIEVILSDDCSTQSYQQEIKPFLNKLLIKQVKTDYNYCPGNTRQRGVDYATGKWLIFADHDDAFYPDSLILVKKELRAYEREDNNTIAFFTGFPKTTDNKDEIMEFFSSKHITGWTHGKVFNLDNFWKKYDIHYIKDLTSHEDVSINSQISYILNINPELKVANTDDIIFYRWIYSPDSASNKQYKQPGEDFSRPFLDIFLTDYLDSTGNITYQQMQKFKPQTPYQQDYCKRVLFDTILLYYFYHQFGLYITEPALKRNFVAIHDFLVKLKNTFGYSIQEIYNYYYINKQRFGAVMQDSIIATGYIMPKYTFKEWLDLVWNEKY